MRPLGLALMGLLGAGCSRTEAPAPPAAPATGPASAVSSEAQAPVPAALRALWRESVKYRRAHETLASNAPSKAKDVERVRRMLASASALSQVPVVTDLAADAQRVQARLVLHAGTVSEGGVAIEVTAAKGPPALPAEVRTDKGFEYTAEQVLGAHRVQARLAGGPAVGARFVSRLGELERLVIIERARAVKGAVLLEGRIPLFWDLTPVRFTRAPVDVPLKLVSAVGDPAQLSGRAAEVAAEIRANFAAVDALAAPLAKALSHEARGKLDLARFNAWKAQKAVFKAAEWSAVFKTPKR